MGHEHPKAGNARRPDIQGLRAIAVLAVVAYHADLPLPGGFVGVDVFFVVSGFVITALLKREWEKTGRIDLASFYLRRFKRLMPALALVITVTAILSAALLAPAGPQSSTFETALAALILLGNLVIFQNSDDYFDASAETNALLHTWSLSVEEQFYLAFPLLLMVLWRVTRRRSLHLDIAVIIILIAASYAVAHNAARGTLNSGFLTSFYSPITRVWEFGVGALVALASTKASFLPWRPSRWMSLGAGVGLGLIGLSFFVISSDTPFPGPWTLLPVLGTSMTILFAPRAPTIERVLSPLPLVRVGDLSYSIYLWHWPFIVFAAAFSPDSPYIRAGAALISLLPAIASYRWLEEPIRHRNVALGFPMIRLAAVTIMPPIMISTLLLVSLGRSYSSPQIESYREAVLRVTPGCHGYLALNRRAVEECTWNADASGSPIYLVGDSHAKHLSTGVISAAEELDRPVIISTASACMVVDVYIHRVGDPVRRSHECRSYMEGTHAFLSSSSPGLVVLSAYDIYWRDEQYKLGTTEARLTASTEQKIALAQKVLTDTVQRVREYGHEVLMVQDVPNWELQDHWDPNHCTTISLIRSAEGCRQTMPMQRALHRQGAVRRVINSVAGEADIRVLDPWPELCPEEICETASSQLARYRDDDHISVAQSARLASSFVDAIRGYDLRR